MINPINTMGIPEIYKTASNTNAIQERKEAVLINRNDLFTSDELKTLENMKEYAKSQGISEREIATLDAVIVTEKAAAKMESRETSFTDIFQNQIQGRKDGHSKNSELTLGTLQHLLDNFNVYQGVDKLA